MVLVQEEARESKDRLFILTTTEAEDATLTEVVVQGEQVVFNKILKITRIQKMQVVAEEEETLEQGGVLEEEVHGKTGKTIILMYVIYVEDMVTMQMSVTIETTIEDLVVVETSKIIMRQLQIETVESTCLSCSI